MMDKIKDWFFSGDWLMHISLFILLLIMVNIINKSHLPEPPPKTQSVTLEDGTKCVVLKGFYSDNAITCNWGK